MKSKETQTIYNGRYSKKLGTINNLEIDERTNYILIPARTIDGKSTSWGIYRLSKDSSYDIDFKHDVGIEDE